MGLGHKSTIASWSTWLEMDIEGHGLSIGAFASSLNGYGILKIRQSANQRKPSERCLSVAKVT